MQNLRILNFGYNFDKYVNKFNELCYKLQDFTVNDQIAGILRGLPYEVIEKVKEKNPSSLMGTITSSRSEFNIVSGQYRSEGNKLNNLNQPKSNGKHGNSNNNNNN